jgi:hypothetical protein
MVVAMVRSCVETVLSFCADKFSFLSRKQEAAVGYVAISAAANINARPSKTWGVATTPQLRVIDRNTRVRSRPRLENFM